jgi:hypothetical protein
MKEKNERAESRSQKSEVRSQKDKVETASTDFLFFYSGF